MNITEIVNLDERARTAISLGESHFREFKSALHGSPGEKNIRSIKAICKDIGEALVAFANADGGELLVGVEDNGTITGVESIDRQKISQLENSPVTHVHLDTPLPPIRKATLILEGHEILYFSVHKSTTHVHLTSDGRCVQRKDLQTVPIPPEQILFNRREKVSREYDRLYVDGANPSDLDQDLVEAVANQISPGMSNEKCLQYLDLAEYVGPGLRLRKAALLLFAKEPNIWHPRLQLRIIKVDGTKLKTGTQYNVKSDQTVSGNIIELVEKGWDSLRPQLVQTRLSSDARFESTFMYPELACREALVNAIAHRDYSEEGTGIEIYVYDDRMEVRNPGALLSSVDINDLLRLEGIHESRNSMVSRVLRELGYMRELGEGMRRMFELMHMNELTAPLLESSGKSFCVTLKHKTIYTNEQKLWLDQFEALNLDREQKSIVVLGIDSKLIAPQDIIDRLGIVDIERYRQLIKSLQDLGVLTTEVSKRKASGKARQQRISVRKIPRFKIAKPSTIKSTIKRVAKTEIPDPNAIIFVWNLKYDLVESELIDLFSQYGQVENISIPKKHNSTLNKGYAFVEFASPEIAESILSVINGFVLRGRPIFAKKSEPK